MSRRLISRRHFLGLPLTFLLAPHVAWPARGWAATTSEERKRTYTADVGILYGLLSFAWTGPSARRSTGPPATIRARSRGRETASPTESSLVGASGTGAGCRSRGAPGSA